MILLSADIAAVSVSYEPELLVLGGTREKDFWRESNAFNHIRIHTQGGESETTHIELHLKPNPQVLCVQKSTNFEVKFHGSSSHVLCYISVSRFGSSCSL